jgi:hypothetical protein
MLQLSICAIYHLTGHAAFTRIMYGSGHCMDDIFKMKFYFRYGSVYSKDIPDVITGGAFLEKYGHHGDSN